MKEEQVILVNMNDNQIGVLEKLEAHQKGMLHSAISVFVFNSDNKLLLQRRALNKYHSSGLWSNTCCGNPRPGEDTKEAASRRLIEEMGISCALSHTFFIPYRVDFENNLVEHEYDHCFTGISDRLPLLNKEEAIEYKYLTLADIKTDMA